MRSNRPTAPPRMLTVRAAAREYGFSEWQLRDAIGAEQLPAVRLPNGRIYIDRRDLERAIEAWKHHAVEHAMRRIQRPERLRGDRGQFVRADANSGDSAGTEHATKPH
jgi:hypothetical protein